MKYSTENDFKELAKTIPYYKYNRWKYYEPCINIIKELERTEKITSVLELGSAARPLVVDCDTMDNNPEDNRPFTYFMDATNLPWPITDKKYDLFVSLQTFEHLEGKQKEIFQEVKRIARFALLCLPLEWPGSDPAHHVTRKNIQEWTENLSPIKEIIVDQGYKRIINLWKF